MDPAGAQPQGTSINFDAQALHDAEEAEFQREEDERQNELKNLLTCAFDCDLSEEDSMDEDTSQNLSHHHGDQGAAPGNNQWQQRANGHVRRPHPGSHQYMMAHASTPIQGQAPPLGSPGGNLPQAYTPYNQAIHTGEPGTFQEQPQQFQEPDQQFHETNARFQEPPQKFQEPTSAFQEPVHQFEGHNLLNVGQLRSGGIEGGPFMQHVEGMIGERGEVEGGNEENGAVAHAMAPPSHPHHPRAQYPPNYPTTNFRYPRPQIYDGQEAASDQDRDIYAPSLPDRSTPRGSLPQPTQQAPFGNPNMEGYQVQYVTNKPLEDTSGVSTVSVESDVLASEAGSTMPRPATPGEEAVTMQKEFLSPEGTPRGGQFTQLEILYRARGNKIEELITELKQVKDDSDRDIRILKHKLTLVEGERDGIKGSLEQSKQLLTETKQREQELQHKVHDFENQLQALVNHKTELLNKVADDESHIEALTAQLADLGTSEALVRTREQHESLVAGLRHKYDTELLTLRQQFDQAKRASEEKEEELAGVKAEALGLMKEVETCRVERGEAVNQLTRSLEESQRQCRDLLETGMSQDAGKLKIQLQETIAGKSIAEDMNSGLQEEIKELKEQLTMYESASQFGALPGASSVGASTLNPTLDPTRMDDSYSQLGIRQSANDGTDVPDSARSEENAAAAALNADTVHGLKKELERCLAMYKGKREQLSATTEQLKGANNTLDDLKQKLEKTEKQLKETKLKLSLQEMSRSGESSLKEVRLQKEMDKILTEKESFRMELENELTKYTAAAASGASTLKEAQLTKQCEQLTNEKQVILLELQEIRQRFDEVALSEEKATELVGELRGQMSAMVRDYDDDKRQAVEKCQEACLQHHEDSKQKLREELEQEMVTQKQQLSAEYDDKITNLKEELRASHADLDEVKETYVTVCREKDEVEVKVNSEWEQRLNVELHQLRLELQAEAKRALEQQLESVSTEHEVALTNARHIWRQEQQAEQTQAIDKGIAEAKEEWRQAQEEGQRQAVQAAVEGAVRDTEQRLQQQIRDQCNTDMEHMLQETKLKWQTDKRVGLERELQERLQAAKDAWTSVELPAAIEDAKQTWHTTLLGDFPTIEEKISKAVSDAKREWKNKAKKDRDQSENKVRELSKLVVEVETKVEKENWDLKQDVNRLRVEKSTVETELTEARESWQAERMRIIEEKDVERVAAVKEVREQGESEYRVFLEEHKDTLNKALKAAREGHEREREELKKTHEQELKSLQTKLEKEISNCTSLAEEKDAAEAQWREKQDALVEQQRQEKEALTAQHREHLHAALEDARARWSEDAEKLKTEKQQLSEREQSLEEENSKNRAELARLESLLQSADAHMEAEIEKLHRELDETHQKELSQQIHAQVTKVENELTKRLDTVLGEKSALNGKLEETRNLLKELESKYKKDTSNLAEKARSYKHDLQAARKELEEKWRAQEGIESQKGQLSTKLKELERQVEKAEKQRREVVEAYRKSEAEYSAIVDSYKLRQTELNDKVKKLEHQINIAENEAKRQYNLLHESLEREHARTVETLKQEMMDLRAKHKRSTDGLKKEYSAEKNKWKKEAEAMKRQARTLSTSSTQDSWMQDYDTDSSCVTIDEATLQEMKHRYTRAVAKMKQDVIRHVTKSNELAAETVKIEVLKERHKTARRIRKHYMKCLAELLDDDRGRDQKLKVMEAALDNIPSATSSAATSRTATPSVADFKTPTPSDFAPMEALSSTLRSHVEKQPRSGQFPISGTMQFTPPTNERYGGKSSKDRKREMRAQSEDRIARSRSADRRGNSDADNSSLVLQAYCGRDGSESATPVQTPAETPIEELLRQEQILKEKLARQAHLINHRGHKSNSLEREYRHHRSGDYGDYFDSNSTSKHSSGRESDLLKSRSAHVFESDGRLSNNSSKRTSFGAVTEYPRSPNKHPSEPNLHQHKDSQRSRRLFENTGHSDTGLSMSANRSHSSGPRSSEASMIAIQSAPASPPKHLSKKKSYKYTSLRTNLHPSLTATLPKAASASNLSDVAHKHSTHRQLYDFPANAFYGTPETASKTFQSPPERDGSGSGFTTPTNFITDRSQRSEEKERLSRKAALSSSSGSSITKPTPHKPTRAQSESRLPRPVPSLVQSNNNNNCEIQSQCSSFEKYSPADSGFGTRQTSVAPGNGNISSSEPQMTELRLSWESNPPASFNIHTRYTNT